MSARTEPTRTREHGRKVTLAASPQERIDAIRNVVVEKSFAKVDGVMMDLFTASHIVAVFDALNDANKVLFSSMPVAKMAAVAFKLTKGGAQ